MSARKQSAKTAKPKPRKGKQRVEDDAPNEAVSSPATGPLVVERDRSPLRFRQSK